MNRQEHWQRVYSDNPAERVGWYEPHLELSLGWIAELGLDKDARIIDVGGGASTLVDDLIGDGFPQITVLDLSERALSVAKQRLSGRAEEVTWLEGDITSVELPSDHYDLWHDRAVFHFLTEPEHRAGYVNNLRRSLRAGGHLIIGIFSLEAPPRCSGLEVQRYTPEQLEAELGTPFVLKEQRKDLHVTPGGVEQMYLYCRFDKLR